jgi:ribose 5-phosphate isomerase B
MKIAIASDHAGYGLKEEIRSFLEQRGHHVDDMGAAGHAPSVDYPDFAFEVARTVASGGVDRGILVCGTGIGMSMAANRIDGIRAALCHDSYTARMCREHNDANVLCLGGRTTGVATALDLVAVFLDTGFEGGRHERRVNKIHHPARVEAP